MDGRTKTLGGVLGATLLTIAALSTSSCEDTGDSADGGSGGLLGNVAQICGLSCPARGKGVAYGNASVTGYGAIDGFFRSVVNYNKVAASVAEDIDAELTGIQSLFQISDAELKAQANLGAAIKAKLQTTYKASVVVNAQPAKCSVDARVTAEATARCQLEAKCDVDPGKATLQCMGTCTVDASVEGRCSADASVRCTVSGPQVACQGECSGTCTVQTPVVNCSGTCRGTCMGTCSAAGDANGDGVTASGECVGTCSGTCQAGCEVTGMAALDCKGSCNGSCEYTPPSATCEANAEVSCDLNAQASASCTGRCDGEFVPPKASCDASASCEASAKAEAKFQVHCTPPSVEVKVVAQAGAMAQAQVDFLIAQLKLRLPRLSAATARAKLASKAADDLRTNGTSAVQTTFNAVAHGEVDAITSLRILNCTGDQLQESSDVIMDANARLQTSTGNADSVANAFSMVM